jgi:glycosyltransferase involved in cell wall biosynthesis
VVAVTPSIAQRFRAINKQTIIVRNYPYPKEVVFAQPSLPWASRRQSVAYVGGISALRSIREMVEAMALLPSTLPAALELAGNEVPEGLRPEELYNHAGWLRVRHHGLLDQPSTFRLLHRVRAGLVLFHPVPNHMEAMPQKIFEYMGAGIPLIVSDFPMWRKLLENTGCALFVDALDSQAIANAIEYILTHPQEAEGMGLLGQAAVLEKYNWDDEAEKLVSLYSGIKDSVCVA